MAEAWTVGVEEEYQIVDQHTRALRPRAERIVPPARPVVGEEIEHELYLSQVEGVTAVCATLGEVRERLTRSRRVLMASARRTGSFIAAAGTHPFSHWAEQPLTPKERYQSIVATFQQIAGELVIFGCHVHVGMVDRETGVEVLNRMRPWLHPLLALTANSPFWLGQDTGYSSFRTEIWNRFPLSGPPQPFASLAEYNAVVAALVQTGTIRDTTNIYWDMRLPERVPTLEVRVADVCMSVDEAVMYTGLVRALVRTCYDAARRSTPYEVVRPELVRAAHWHAARYGLDGTLLDLHAARPAPAHSMVMALLDWVRPALEDAGDWDEVSTLVADTLRHGNGATRQRAAFAQRGNMQDVVDLLVRETSDLSV
jgi:glutamate---cysteine ligase / carboxylate-amine ligase